MLKIAPGDVIPHVLVLHPSGAVCRFNPNPQTFKIVPDDFVSNLGPLGSRPGPGAKTHTARKSGPYVFWLGD
jgi:hypothetical protein